MYRGSIVKFIVPGHNCSVVDCVWVAWVTVSDKVLARLALKLSALVADFDTVELMACVRDRESPADSDAESLRLHVRDCEFDADVVGGDSSVIEAACVGLVVPLADQVFDGVGGGLRDADADVSSLPVIVGIVRVRLTLSLGVILKLPESTPDTERVGVGGGLRDSVCDNSGEVDTVCFPVAVSVCVTKLV